MRFFYLGACLLLARPIFALLGDAQDSEHLKNEPIVEFASDQVKVIENLIEIEEKNLELHKELKVLILQIREEEELFLQEPDSQEKAKNLIYSARKALELIADMKLDHLFSSNFLKDLHFYSSIAGKNKPSRPG